MKLIFKLISFASLILNAFCVGYLFGYKDLCMVRINRRTPAYTTYYRPFPSYRSYTDYSKSRFEEEE